MLELVGYLLHRRRLTRRTALCLPRQLAHFLIGFFKVSGQSLHLLGYLVELRRPDVRRLQSLLLYLQLGGYVGNAFSLFVEYALCFLPLSAPCVICFLSSFVLGVGRIMRLLPCGGFRFSLTLGFFSGVLCRLLGLTLLLPKLLFKFNLSLLSRYGFLLQLLCQSYALLQ